MKHITVLFIFVTLLSCDPCPDCGEPLTSEPTVEMIFINQDSIDLIDEELIVLDSLDSSFIAINALLVDFRDSLNRIQDSIANMLNEYLDEEADLLDSIGELELDSIFLDELKIDSTVSVLSTTRATINSGDILVNKVKFPEINDSLIYSDSTTSWNFPLSFEKTFTIYEVFIQDETLVIELDYETFTEIDVERNVRIRAENIQVVDTAGVDSLNVCEQNCVDGTASFTFYF